MEFYELCPYCSHEHEYDVEDFFEFGVYIKMECEGCGKEFRMSLSIDSDVITSETYNQRLKSLQELYEKIKKQKSENQKEE